MQTSQSQESFEEIRALYRSLLDSWNKRDAAAYAALFVEDGLAIGFDGSQHTGRAKMAAEIGAIFAHHPTAAYVSKVRDVRFLSPESAVLWAVVGMIPPGQSDINPAVNAIQSLVAVKDAGQWRIVQFQNTPAQFHGRPELMQQLTDEIRQMLK